jgi:hypothetical protein
VFVMVGAVAQLGEHLLCKQGVSGSIPLSSTKSFVLTLSQQSCFAADGAANDGRRALALANLDGSRDVALVWRDETISFEENKVCELPVGVSPVLKNCEEKIDLEASRYCEFRLTMSETFPIDP